MQRRQVSRPRRGLALAVILFACCAAARAQDEQSISVDSVERQGDVVLITLKFASPLNKEDQAAATLAANYSVLDTSERKYIRVCADVPCAPRLLFPGGDPSRRPNLVLLQVRDALTLEDEEPGGAGEPRPQVQATKRYYVQAEKLTVKGRPSEQALLAPLPVKAKAAQGEGAGEADEGKYETTEDREEANIYLSGELARASGTDFSGTADIRIKQPIAYADFWNTSHEIGPFLDFVGSTDPSADPDTLEFGIDWLSQVAGARGRLQGVFWNNEGKFEAERDFDNVNLTWGSRFTFVPQTWQDRRAEKVLFYVRPFVGTELGRNLKSPVPEADGGGLARLLVGSSLNLRFPLKRVGQESALSLAVTYERRWPLKREVSFEEEDDGTLKALTFGTNPRDWVDAKLIFKFNKFFGPFIGYQYGEKPPSFKLVDHQMKLGFIISAKRKE